MTVAPPPTGHGAIPKERTTNKPNEHYPHYNQSIPYRRETGRDALFLRVKYRI